MQLYKTQQQKYLAMSMYVSLRIGESGFYVHLITYLVRNISKTSASFIGVSKHEKTVFECLETPMKHEARFFEITSPTKEN